MRVLRLAETVAKAGELPKPKLHAFCEEVGLEPEGSTFRKLRAIGDRIDRLEPHAERMPYAWTTVYRLAVLTDEEFERVVRSGCFRPTMTASEIESIVSSKPLGKKKVTAARDVATMKLAKKDVAPLSDATAPTTAGEEEEDVAPTTPTKRTVSDLKSLVESSTSAGKRPDEGVEELDPFELRLDLSDLNDEGKRAVYWAIKRLHRDHNFTMDAGDGLTRLAMPRAAA